MKTSDFDYILPEELIAQDPLADRSSSRLLVLSRESGEVSHERFSDIGRHFRAGDVLVINDTKVIPARLLGRKEETNAAVELLLLKRVTEHEWETLVKPGKKCRVGTVIRFGEPDDAGEVPLRAEIVDILDGGTRRVHFTYSGVFEEVLSKLGEMPLPPYIHHKLLDGTRYNTVYAEHDGSAAAPTAGLHFTPELMANLEKMGVEIVRVTLHVGLGTFRPVKEETFLEHHMHEETYIVPEEAARAINAAKAEGRRVICVGTTSCRTLEAAADENGVVRAGSASTDIFIYPGYKFKVMDGLITNFHLPKSTLIMLVSAFAGREHVLAAYRTAVEEKYRFYSLGDAMLVI